MRRLERRLSGLTRGEHGHSLETILEAHLDRVLSVGHEVDELAARTAILEAATRRALQRVGLVRYNPFAETGGNQSFALALLDAEANGFIVNSLHARTGTRIYVRVLTGGRVEGQLSEEEGEALGLALGTAAGRPAIVDRPEARTRRGA